MTSTARGAAALPKRSWRAGIGKSMLPDHSCFPAARRTKPALNAFAITFAGQLDTATH
jgi:hypothetical protein